MLQRGIPAALQWVLPALSSAGCHLQQAAQVAESPCSTSGREFNAWHQYSRHSMQFTRHIRLKPGTVDMRNQPRRASRPYFNPDDGPEGVTQRGCINLPMQQELPLAVRASICCMLMLEQHCPQCCLPGEMFPSKKSMVPSQASVLPLLNCSILLLERPLG